MDIIKGTNNSNDQENRNNMKMEQEDCLECIFLNSEHYLGSTTPKNETLWVYKNDEEFEKRVVEYIPALLNHLNLLLINVLDQKKNDPSLTMLKVSVDRTNNKISIWYNGKGIPIEIDHKTKIYSIERLYGSINYQDFQNKEKKLSQINNMKLCNLFCKEFIIETNNSQNGKKYFQVFSNNLQETKAPLIKKGNKRNFTKITITPDLEKFGVKSLDNDLISIFKKRVYDIAGTIRGIRVYLNGNKLEIRNFQQYCENYTSQIKLLKEEKKLVHEKSKKFWEIILYFNVNGFEQYSFANSHFTSNGGNHLNYVIEKITHSLSQKLMRKYKINLDPIFIKNHLCIYLKAVIENPQFKNKFSKETIKKELITNVELLENRWKISNNFLTKIEKCGIIENILKMYNQSLNKNDKINPKVNIEQLQKKNKEKLKKNVSNTIEKKTGKRKNNLNENISNIIQENLQNAQTNKKINQQKDQKCIELNQFNNTNMNNKNQDNIKEANIIKEHQDLKREENENIFDNKQPTFKKIKMGTIKDQNHVSMNIYNKQTKQKKLTEKNQKKIKTLQSGAINNLKMDEKGQYHPNLNETQHLNEKEKKKKLKKKLIIPNFKKINEQNKKCQIEYQNNESKIINNSKKKENIESKSKNEQEKRIIKKQNDQNQNKEYSNEKYHFNIGVELSSNKKENKTKEIKNITKSNNFDFKNKKINKSVEEKKNKIKKENIKKGRKKIIIMKIKKREKKKNIKNENKEGKKIENPNKVGKMNNLSNFLKKNEKEENNEKKIIKNTSENIKKNKNEKLKIQISRNKYMVKHLKKVNIKKKKKKKGGIEILKDIVEKKKKNDDNDQNSEKEKEKEKKEYEEKFVEEEEKEEEEAGANENECFNYLHSERGKEKVYKEEEEKSEDAIDIKNDKNEEIEKEEEEEEEEDDDDDDEEEEDNKIEEIISSENVIDEQYERFSDEEKKEKEEEKKNEEEIVKEEGEEEEECDNENGGFNHLRSEKGKEKVYKEEEEKSEDVIDIKNDKNEEIEKEEEEEDDDDDEDGDEEEEDNKIEEIISSENVIDEQYERFSDEEKKEKEKEEANGEEEEDDDDNKNEGFNDLHSEKGKENVYQEEEEKSEDVIDIKNDKNEEIEKDEESEEGNEGDDGGKEKMGGEEEYKKNDFQIQNKKIKLNELQKIPIYIRKNTQEICSLIDGLTTFEREIIHDIIQDNQNFNNKYTPNNYYTIFTQKIFKKKKKKKKNLIFRNTILNSNLLNSNVLFQKRQNIYLNSLNNGGYHKINIYKQSSILRKFFKIEDLNRFQYFTPILPIVLLKGSIQMGFNFSKGLPSYHPKDIIMNLIKIMENKKYKEMLPWFPNFNGKISKINKKLQKRKKNQKGEGKKEKKIYKIKGVWKKIDNNILEIHELPIVSKYSQNKKSYSSFLFSLMKKNHANNNKIKNIDQINIEKTFRLSCKLKLIDTQLKNENGINRNFKSAKDILEQFYKIRSKLLKEKKKELIKEIEFKIFKTRNIAMFIEMVIHKEIKFLKKSKQNIFNRLKQLGFYSQDPQNNDLGTTNEKYMNKEAFNYLFNLPISNFKIEKYQSLLKQISALKKEKKVLTKTSIKEIWKKELINFLNKWNRKSQKKKSINISKFSNTEKAVENKIESNIENIIENVDENNDSKKENEDQNTNNSKIDKTKKSQKERKVGIEFENKNEINSYIKNKNESNIEKEEENKSQSESQNENNSKKESEEEEINIKNNSESDYQEEKEEEEKENEKEKENESETENKENGINNKSEEKEKNNEAGNTNKYKKKKLKVRNQDKSERICEILKTNKKVNWDESKCENEDQNTKERKSDKTKKSQKERNFGIEFENKNEINSYINNKNKSNIEKEKENKSQSESQNENNSESESEEEEEEDENQSESENQKQNSRSENKEENENENENEFNGKGSERESDNEIEINNKKENKNRSKSGEEVMGKEEKREESERKKIIEFENVHISKIKEKKRNKIKNQKENEIANKEKGINNKREEKEKNNEAENTNEEMKQELKVDNQDKYGNSCEYKTVDDNKNTGNENKKKGNSKTNQEIENESNSYIQKKNCNNQKIKKKENENEKILKRKENEVWNEFGNTIKNMGKKWGIENQDKFKSFSEHKIINKKESGNRRNDDKTRNKIQRECGKNNNLLYKIDKKNQQNNKKEREAENTNLNESFVESKKQRNSQSNIKKIKKYSKNKIDQENFNFSNFSKNKENRAINKKSKHKKKNEKNRIDSINTNKTNILKSVENKNKTNSKNEKLKSYLFFDRKDDYIKTNNKIINKKNKIHFPSKTPFTIYCQDNNNNKENKKLKNSDVIRSINSKKNQKKIKTINKTPENKLQSLKKNENQFRRSQSIDFSLSGNSIKNKLSRRLDTNNIHLFRTPNTLYQNKSEKNQISFLKPKKIYSNTDIKKKKKSKYFIGKKIKNGIKQFELSNQITSSPFNWLNNLSDQDSSEFDIYPSRRKDLEPKKMMKTKFSKIKSDLFSQSNSDSESLSYSNSDSDSDSDFQMTEDIDDSDWI
ncbi:DNA topoisomerase/gyrase [Anaeramoeba flamelloides]|uniref:DNA topoisomerase (ATP-hydrolyzing) n=1 Tax=Anaeramoeba flamelloides TaxID=1746091 RepID=A0AAV7Z831_9EUKA|nr:DNA topoisomerase/gyrase [Anaeramoeba flamelloides]